jgi:cell division septation protein DedD
MTDIDRELSLQDEDRLPWLEAVEDDEEEGLSSTRVLGFVVASLLALSLVVGGIWWLRGQQKPIPGSSEDTLIAAQEGDYKVKPEAPGGMKVEGQGDSSFAASEGSVANGKMDMNAQPETPVAATKGAIPPATPAKPVAAGKSATTAVPATPLGKLAVNTPAAPAAAPATGGGLVQLGAYGSEATASAAWAQLAKKSPQLAAMTKTVAPAAVGGNTVYRLRANAGTPQAAATLCGAVKASGGSCMVVR